MAQVTGSSGLHGRIEATFLLCSYFRKILRDGHMQVTKKLKTGDGSQRAAHTAARLTTADPLVLC